jgi:hypothetical protein
MRASGVRGVVVYCQDHRCSRLVVLSAERWADDVRLSDIEDAFTCSACGKCGADGRPDFNLKAKPVSGIGYR